MIDLKFTQMIGNEYEYIGHDLLFIVFSALVKTRLIYICIYKCICIVVYFY